MTKIYKTGKKGGNGECYLTTNVITLEDFQREFSTALCQAIQTRLGDESHLLDCILPYAFQMAFKVAGYKSDLVRETRTFEIGYATVDEKENIGTASLTNSTIVKLPENS